MVVKIKTLPYLPVIRWTSCVTLWASITLHNTTDHIQYRTFNYASNNVSSLWAVSNISLGLLYSETFINTAESVRNVKTTFSVTLYTQGITTANSSNVIVNCVNERQSACNYCLQRTDATAILVIKLYMPPFSTDMSRSHYW